MRSEHPAGLGEEWREDAADGGTRRTSRGAIPILELNGSRYASQTTSSHGLGNRSVQMADGTCAEVADTGSEFDDPTRRSE